LIIFCYTSGLQKSGWKTQKRCETFYMLDFSGHLGGVLWVSGLQKLRFYEGFRNTSYQGCKKNDFLCGLVKKGVAEKNSFTYIALLAERHLVTQWAARAPLSSGAFNLETVHSFPAIWHREYWEERRRRRSAVSRLGNKLHIKWTTLCLKFLFESYDIAWVTSSDLFGLLIWGTRNFLWTQT